MLFSGIILDYWFTKPITKMLCYQVFTSIHIHNSDALLKGTMAGTLLVFEPETLRLQAQLIRCYIF